MSMSMPLPAALIFALALPFGPIRAAVITQSGAEAAVRGANDAEVAAFLANDPAALARLWSDKFMVTNPFNALVNKGQVLGMVRGGVLGFKAYVRTLDYLRVEGGIAIVAGSETTTFAGNTALTGKTTHLRFTAVWMKEGEAWREVVRHASIVP